MAILDSLKKLGRKMTGSPVQGTDIESAIDSIANKYSGGGGNIFIVRFDWDDEDNVFCDKTYSEIRAALVSGLPVVGSDGELLTAIEDIDGGDMIGIRFSGAFHFTQHDSTINRIEVYSYTVWPDESVIEEYFEKEFD